MKIARVPVSVLITALLSAAGGFADQAGQMPLGHDPLCEASAALVAPWDPTLVLVADNEDAADIFAFKVEHGLLVGQTPMKVPKQGRPKDVEALVVAGDRLGLIGSQSRDSRCATKPQRQRIAFYRWNGGAARLALDRAIDGARAITVGRRVRGRA